MIQGDLLRHVIDVLERLNIRYFVTGSTATMYFGEARLTNDIDVVVDLSGAQVGGLMAEFPASDFYLSEEAIQSAIRHRSQFNIIHPETGLKVDMIVAEDTPFNRSRFARTVRVKPEPDYDASFASAEDVIVKKLCFFQDGGSEKHLRDIVGVLKVGGDRIDRQYIGEWARRLGVDQEWAAVQRRATLG